MSVNAGGRRNGGGRELSLRWTIAAVIGAILVVAAGGREREIAHLAVSGRTSRQIAERLVLSVRTVENHLQSTYTKLGITGRSELRTTLLN